MNKVIPLSVPNLKGNELKYVSEVITEEWVSTGGKMINQFESNFAEYVKSGTATACQSGTAGLHLAMLLSGIGKEHEVIVPTLTFIAAINPVSYTGAQPVFMDCDNSLCIDANKLEEFCSCECNFTDGKLYNKHTKKHIKAIVVVHVFGNMADLERIIPLAKKYNLTVIEDATEALGTFYTDGSYKGRYAGTVGDIGVYSFNGNKIITTGGGGMLVSSKPEVTKRAKYLSTQAKDDELYFIHNEVGYNYRMTNLQAALGLAQLEQLEGFIKIKKHNYDYYKETISNMEHMELLPFKANTRPNYWYFSLYLDNHKYTRDSLIKYFSDNRIQTRPIWGLIHQQQPYKNCYSFKIEKAIDYQNRIINLPCSTNLTEEDIREVLKQLKMYK